MIEFISAFPSNNTAKNLSAYPASGYQIELVLQFFCWVMWMWILYIVHLYFILFYILVYVH